MNESNWNQRIQITIARAEESIVVISGLCRDRTFYKPNSIRAKRLLERSGDFSESVAKLVSAQRGIVPKHIHDVRRLATALDPHDPMRPRVESLNGETQKHHTEMYQEGHLDDPEGVINHCLKRIQQGFGILADILDEVNLDIELVSRRDQKLLDIVLDDAEVTLSQDIVDALETLYTQASESIKSSSLGQRLPSIHHEAKRALEGVRQVNAGIRREWEDILKPAPP